MRSLQILYRGPLDSCNYGCSYCPFGKKKQSRAELVRDRAALERFSARVAELTSVRFSIFFTPWGEALVRRAYRQAMVSLSRLAHVDRVAVQTNLSAPLGFVDEAVVHKLGFWATYHPDWTTRERFVRRVRDLHAKGARVSVGIVGFRRFLDEAEALRRELPGGVYQWINAVKRTPAPEPYEEDDLARLSAIDPLFSYNLADHPSLGKACRTGEDAITVDGDGVMRRCHFVRAPIGNLFDPDWDRALVPRACPANTCGCHIGYVHVHHLGLGAVFGSGLLERVPLRLPVLAPSQSVSAAHAASAAAISQS